MFALGANAPISRPNIDTVPDADWGHRHRPQVERPSFRPRGVNSSAQTRQNLAAAAFPLLV